MRQKSEAGNFAVSLGARGRAYIAGGIVPRLGVRWAPDYFAAGSMRKVASGLTSRRSRPSSSPGPIPRCLDLPPGLSSARRTEENRVNDFRVMRSRFRDPPSDEAVPRTRSSWRRLKVEESNGLRPPMPTGLCLMYRAAEARAPGRDKCISIE